MLFYFNSIKVQLEQSYVTESKLVGIQFQFHKGTIRTCQLVVSLLHLLNFNSIKVQLEPVNP